MHTYIHTNIQTCIHTCIHTYIHTYIQLILQRYLILPTSSLKGAVMGGTWQVMRHSTRNGTNRCQTCLSNLSTLHTTCKTTRSRWIKENQGGLLLPLPAHVTSSVFNQRSERITRSDQFHQQSPHSRHAMQKHAETSGATLYRSP